jgi:hypothetical protein
MTVMTALHNPDAEQLHLWTIQQHEAWEKLRDSGVLRADGRRIWRDFRPAYRWLIAQMHLRLGSCAARYPLWAWHRPKPDLRHGGHLPPGSHGLRIEFVIPAARVLLFGYDAWHAVLNGWYLSLTEAEDGRWEEKLRKRNADRKRLPTDLQAEMEESWERVFDLPALDESGWVGSAPYVQAVLEEIRLEEVRDVKPFVAR